MRDSTKNNRGKDQVVGPQTTCTVWKKQSISSTEILIYPSKINLGAKLLSGKITPLLDSEIKRMLVKDCYRNENSTLNSVP